MGMNHRLQLHEDNERDERHFVAKTLFAQFDSLKPAQKTRIHKLIAESASWMTVLNEIKGKNSDIRDFIRSSDSAIIIDRSKNSNLQVYVTFYTS
jgi:hypothetical protein